MGIFWKDQIFFFDNEHQYRVGDVYEKLIRSETVLVSIDNLECPFCEEICSEGQNSTKFWERANASDVKCAILVIEENGRLWVADGKHRLAKAKSIGMKYIPAHIVNAKELKIKVKKIKLPLFKLF